MMRSGCVSEAQREGQASGGDGLAHFRAFLLDLDGVVYRGERLLAGARELVDWADATGRRVLFLSNNSFATVDEVAAKLARLGVARPQGRTLTAGYAASQAIAQRFPGGSVYALAVPSVAGMLREAGLRLVADEAPTGGAPTGARVNGEPTHSVTPHHDERPDAVLVGLDRTLTYARLRQALRAILAGSAFYAVNRDPRLPIEDGFEPGTGSLVAALEYASGMSAEVIGKPGPGIVYQALKRIEATADETLMIGDALDLDVVAGHAAGLATALVLSGLSAPQDAAAATGARKPEYVFADLAALLAALRASAR